MQRTFCDRQRDGQACGRECEYYTLNLYGAVRHTDSRGRDVGMDELPAVQFCKPCADELRAQFGLRLYCPSDEQPLDERATAPSALQDW